MERNKQIPTTLYFFDSGQVACCDQNRQQIGELQKNALMTWVADAIAQGYDVDQIKEIHMPSGRWKLIKWELDGETGYNYDRL